MVYHGDDILCFVIKLDRLIMLGFLLERDSLSLCGRFLAYFLDWFSVLHTNLRSVWGHATHILFLCLADCSDILHVFLALSSAALLRVGRQGKFSSLSFTAMTRTFGIFPYGGFRSWFSFVDLFGNFHPLKHIAGLLVGLPDWIPIPVDRTSLSAR